MTNREFANAVGCSPTMASRMRNGLRAPSVSMLHGVIQVFGLDEGDALLAARQPDTWGSYLRDRVFTRTGAHASAQSMQPEEAHSE